MSALEPENLVFKISAKLVTFGLLQRVGTGVSPR